MKRFGFGFDLGKGGGNSWPNYWSNSGLFLFFGEVSKISEGKLNNQVIGSSDYLTVSGNAGSEIYQAPNTTPYIAADTDYIWFKMDASQRTTTTAELIGYDLQRTPVNYDDDSPNTIRWIGILKLTTNINLILDKLFKSFFLPIEWNNDTNQYGHLKSNRIGQILFTPEPLPPISLTLLQLTDTTLKLIWDDFTGTISIERSITDETNYAEIHTIAAGTELWTDITPVIPNKYYYRLRAYNITGYSSYCASANLTMASQQPAVITDGNTIAWYDSSDLTTVTKDGSNHVTKLANKLGDTTSDLDTYGGTPTWSANGITFDGTDDYLKKNFTYAQPEFIYLVLKQLSWTNGDYLMDGGGITKGALKQQTGTPNICAFVTVAGSESSQLVVNTLGIVRILFSGADSFFIVDRNAKINQSGSLTTAMAGIIFGSRGSIGSYGHLLLVEAICRKVSDSDANQKLIYNFLANKHGLPPIP